MGNKEREQCLVRTGERSESGEVVNSDRGERCSNGDEGVQVAVKERKRGRKQRKADEQPRSKLSRGWLPVLLLTG